MLALERQRLILEYLAENDFATTKTLSEITKASLATLRRDLALMDRQGLLKKTHGGAQNIHSSATNEDNSAQSLVYDPYLEYKAAVSRRAAAFIASNDIIFVGAGMTCNLLCKYINESTVENITIVTTNITAVTELASNPRITILLLGGTVNTGINHIETLDEYTVQTLSKLYFDKAFFTVDGIDLNYGYSIINRAQLPLYNHLIENSRQIYLLATEGKYNKRTFTYLCPLDAIPNVITNSSAEKKYLTYYEEHGVQVFTV